MVEARDPVEISVIRHDKPCVPVSFQDLTAGLWVEVGERQDAPARALIIFQYNHVQYEYVLILLTRPMALVSIDIEKGWKGKAFYPATFSLQITLNPPDLGVK